VSESIITSGARLSRNVRARMAGRWTSGLTSVNANTTQCGMGLSVTALRAAHGRRIRTSQMKNHEFAQLVVSGTVRKLAVSLPQAGQTRS
jgi:hypothetical protein